MPVGFLEYAEARRDAVLETLRDLVETESFSRDKAGVDSLGRYVAGRLEEIGASIEFRRETKVGDHLIATYGGAGKQILVLGHLDTIWPRGTLKTFPFRLKDGRASGPGVFDMKAGIAIIIHALQCLADLNIELERKITVLLTTDEEIGCGTSRALIEAESEGSEFVLCLEAPLGPEGSLKTSRKALGIFRIHVTGIPAHAGNDHKKGVSAIEEMAHQILYLHDLTNYAEGTTVTVGEMNGGVVGNQVAAKAEALGDFRAATLEEERRVVDAIKGLRPVLPGANLRAEVEVNRPLMLPTPQSRELFQIARQAALEIEMDLTEVSVGGGSDAQFAAALGIPVLDGLGCPGDGMFTEDEYIAVSELPRRVALMSKILSEVRLS